MSEPLEVLISRLAVQAKVGIRLMTNEALREAFIKLNCTEAQASSLIRSSAQRRRHEKARLANGR